MTIGKEMKINKCANETNLRDGQVYMHGNDNPSIIIFDRYGATRGYFEIEFCPKCGIKLKGDEE